jgi:predicted site-specific integrase-resolvase
MARKILSKSDFVTITDLGGYFMVSSSTVRRWIKDGKLHASLLPSGQSRVSIQDLAAFQKKYHILSNL